MWLAHWYLAKLAAFFYEYFFIFKQNILIFVQNIFEVRLCQTQIHVIPRKSLMLEKPRLQGVKLIKIIIPKTNSIVEFI